MMRSMSLARLMLLMMVSRRATRAFVSVMNLRAAAQAFAQLRRSSNTTAVTDNSLVTLAHRCFHSVHLRSQAGDLQGRQLLLLLLLQQQHSRKTHLLFQGCDAGYAVGAKLLREADHERIKLALRRCVSETVT